MSGKLDARAGAASSPKRGKDRDKDRDDGGGGHHGSSLAGPPSGKNGDRDGLKAAATAVRGAGRLAARNAAGNVIRFKTGFGNTILDVMLSFGWERVTDPDDDSWDVYWCEPGWVRDAMPALYSHKEALVCHYPNSYELTRKDCGITNMKRLKRQLEKKHGKSADLDVMCDFYPITYTLPSEYHMFVEQFKKIKEPNMAWIMKPVGRAQGKGIFLFTKLSEIIEWKKDTRYQPTKEGEEKREMYVVQRYIPNPLLISRRKFDMRIYVLVTSFRPLRAWLYREGFARFSGSLFSMDKKDIANTFIHLTNVAIQKTAEGYDKSKGCKWLFSRVKGYMQTMFGHEAVEQCIKDMQSVIMTSLQSVQPVMIQDSHCFELYGYDILLDDTLKPWLIEVNASPSLSADTKDDYKLKYGMLEDMFGILTLGKVGLDQNYRRVGGFDLMWNDGEVEEVYNEDEMLSAQPITASRFGGYMADRKQHLDHVLSEAKINMRTRMTSDKSFMSSNMASSGSKT